MISMGCLKYCGQGCWRSISPAAFLVHTAFRLIFQFHSTWHQRAIFYFILKISKNLFNFHLPTLTLFLLMKKYFFLFFQQRESVYFLSLSQGRIKHVFEELRWIQTSAQLGNLSFIHLTHASISHTLSIHASIHSTTYHPLIHPFIICHLFIHLSVYPVMHHHHPPFIHPPIQHILIMLPLAPGTQLE